MQITGTSNILPSQKCKASVLFWVLADCCPLLSCHPYAEWQWIWAGRNSSEMGRLLGADPAPHSSVTLPAMGSQTGWVSVRENRAGRCLMLCTSEVWCQALCTRFSRQLWLFLLVPWFPWERSVRWIPSKVSLYVASFPKNMDIRGRRICKISLLYSFLHVGQYVSPYSVGSKADYST